MDHRDRSRGRSESRLVKHQHSFSESGRSSVPMWDSSDPDRAPPPLPLNPGVHNSPVTKPNVSSNIEKAAALIASRAIDNIPSPYTSNPAPNSSPERQRAQHRRMQSIQTGSVGRLSDSLERRSPEKGLSRSKLSDFDDYRSSRTLELSPIRGGSETPTPSTKSTTIREVDGNENTHPAMLSLQAVRNRQENEAPLADITKAINNIGTTMSLDSLSSQILNVTSIATNLQKEMANLSRRSKDNATDLSGLKEATNARDEDIRKSLRELVSTLDTKFSSIDSRIHGMPDAARSTPNLGLYLEEKAHDTPNRKTLHIPRMTSPSSFLEREITNSPSVVSVDGAASIALLEKVLREMATKDGQERIMGTLEDVKSYAHAKSSQAVVSTSQPTFDPETMKKLEEILVFMKDMRADSGSKALVKAMPYELDRSPSQMDLYLDKSVSQVAQQGRDAGKRSSNIGPSLSSADLLTEDLTKTLKSVKQSLSQNGGLTNEVKALVRELRGEVLGMGRDIARKLEESELPTKTGAHGGQEVATAEITNVVEQGLAELKEHMHHLIRENGQQTAKSIKGNVSTNEIVSAIERVVASHPMPSQAVRDPVAEREEMIAAVREAWEECKPEIALEHFGLERDEILETLKEGLQSYQSPQPTKAVDDSMIYEKVLEAVQAGLRSFSIPQNVAEAGPSKEEVLATVRECLDQSEIGISATRSQLSTASTELTRDEIVEAVKEVLSLQISQPREADFTRDDIIDAVRAGMSEQSHVTKEVEFNRDDLFDAIRACLEGEQNPLGSMGERVVEAMHEFLGSMKTEFQQYSAANGRDTEQVLDALKDGLEELRAEIESYVDRASDVTGKDEIVDTVKAGFAAMQADMEKGFNMRMQPSLNTPELLDAMEKEFEHLRETINKSMARGSSASDKEDILDAIRDLNDDRSSTVSGNPEDIVRFVKEELEHMRNTLAATMIRGGASLERDDVLDAIREGMETHRPNIRADGGESILSNTSELLDAFQEGVDGLRADMQKLVEKPDDLSTSYEILDTLKAGIDSVRADIERLAEKQSDNSDAGASRGQEVMLHEGNNISHEIDGLKVMITQLRIKVEALDNMPIPDPVFPSEMRVHKEDLDDLHSAIRDIHVSVNELPRDFPTPIASIPPGMASKEDTDAIETLIRNVKARVDGLEIPDMSDAARTSHLMSLEDTLREIKDVVDTSISRSAEPTNKEDFTTIELLLKDVQASIESLQTKAPSISDEEGRLSKTDLQVLESICLETKERLDNLSLPNAENIMSKEDVMEIKDTIVAFREQFEADNDLTAQAFEARKIEHGGLATKIDDVRNIVAEVREEIIGKLNGSEEGIVELAKVLGMHHDSMNTYATASSLEELSTMVSKGIDAHTENHATIKAAMEERDATLFDKHDETWTELKAKIEERFIEIMIKYDDAQISNESKLSALEDRDKAHLDATTSVKSVVEDLKPLMDSLGATVSETCEKMSSDSRVVFEKVDESSNKLTDLHITNAHEHGLTRDEIIKAVQATTRLEGTLEVHQPAILSAIQEVLGVVGQHYEHSRQQGESFRIVTDEIKSGVSAIPSAIPPLLPAPEPTRSASVSESVPPKEYDDSEVHMKLDELLSHLNMTKETLQSVNSNQNTTQQTLSGLQQLEKLEQLDAMHSAFKTTADEITAMVATQSRLMAEHHECRAEEAREAAVALEKRTAQKEKVEAEIIALTQEKNALADSMAALRREHEELMGQTKKLSREVGKLETALSIRQEEMRDMNARAESLERRVLEGVMNHARSIKFARPTPQPKVSPAERDASMSLKRVASTASNATAKAQSARNGSSTFSNVMGMALKKRNAPRVQNPTTASARGSHIDRRILSTSHITGNRPSDAHRALVLAPSDNVGLVSLKRSHSVKSNPASYLSGRKPSWNGPESILDKENHEIDHENEASYESGDESSDAGTERRTSYTDTYSDSMVYGTSSSLSRNSMRSVSYSSSVGGALNGRAESIAEEDQESISDDDQFEEINHDATNMALTLAEPVHIDNGIVGEDTQMAIVESMEAEDELGDLPDLQRHEPKYSVPSDSGIGSEPPTPDVSQRGSQVCRSTISSQSG